MIRLTVENALSKLEGQDLPFKELFAHGTLAVEIYKPVGEDLQTPHSRDEIYVVIAGSGYFQKGDSVEPFEAGEVLFVKAGVAHRFVDFTDDFATWVFFYGPEGGESGRAG